MGIGFAELLIVLVALAAALLIIGALIWLLASARSRTESPLLTLKRRYARGEIDSDEFEERRARLLEGRKER
jgi:putative membrane protein